MTKTLLLADDSVVIQKLVGLSFANEPIELITTDNGDDAVTRAREALPDLVLADVVMPGLNGYEVCEAIKQDPDLGNVPVLLLTGTFEAFDEERAIAVGSDGHITKPFEAQVLVDRVNELLEKAGSQAAQPDAAGGVETPAAASAAYEFFDEEPVGPPPSAIAAPADPNAATEFAGADVDDAFSFGGDEPSLDALDSAPSLGTDDSAGGDRTVAMMPQDAAAISAKRGNTMDFDELGATELAPEPAASSAPEALSDAATDPGATLLVADPFDAGQADMNIENAPLGVPASLDFDSEASSPPVLSGEDTLLADDLFGDTGSGMSPNPSDPTAITPSEPIEDFDIEAGDAPLINSDSDLGVTPLEASDAPAPPGVPELPPSPEPVAVSEPTLEPSLLESAPMLDTDTDAFAVATDASPTQAHPAALQSAPDLSPMLRERLHESLEKIAWEAFSDLSETIVKQVLERVESVAWEVIPQMAEALIQEEIRRMKGDRED